MGCGCASFGLHACTSVPITERKQLRLIPEAKLNAQAEQLYEKVKEKDAKAAVHVCKRPRIHRETKLRKIFQRDAAEGD